jgi:hypothetical protein
MTALAAQVRLFKAVSATKNRVIWAKRLEKTYPG